MQLGLIVNHPVDILDTENNNYSTLLINDDILAQVCKDVKLSLYVFINSPSTNPDNSQIIKISKQDSLQYINDVYSKIWDELIAKNKGMYFY